MGDQEARELCGQLRQELIRDVARTGGHLSSNLGVVVRQNVCVLFLMLH